VSRDGRAEGATYSANLSSSKNFGVALILRKVFFPRCRSGTRQHLCDSPDMDGKETPFLRHVRREAGDRGGAGLATTCSWGTPAHGIALISDTLGLASLPVVIPVQEVRVAGVSLLAVGETGNHAV
jgi:hypothetical protein